MIPDRIREAFEPPANFLALPEERSGFAESGVLVLPIPFEATTSYRGGTKHGPAAILGATRQVELYDREFDDEPALRWGIHTLPPMARDLSSPEASIDAIAQVVEELAATGKLLAALGGEHSISIGVARGLRAALGEFVTLQLDAHADLRDIYEGTPYSHACAARRIAEISPVVQAGIRSLDVSEARYLRECGGRVRALFAEEVLADPPSAASRIAEMVRGQRVFLTLDVDVFDPALMPATGTPEPGGLGWEHVLGIIRAISRESEILGFDCVELAPIPELHAPDFLAAKLVYKMMYYAMTSRSHER